MFCKASSVCNKRTSACFVVLINSTPSPYFYKIFSQIFAENLQTFGKHSFLDYILFLAFISFKELILGSLYFELPMGISWYTGTALSRDNHSLVIFWVLLLNSRNLSLDIECWFLKLIASEFLALIWIIQLCVSRLFCVLFYFIGFAHDV